MKTLNEVRDEMYIAALEQGVWREGDTQLDAAQLIRSAAMDLIYAGENCAEFGSAFYNLLDLCFATAGRYKFDLEVCYDTARARTSPQ